MPTAISSFSEFLNTVVASTHEIKKRTESNMKNSYNSSLLLVSCLPTLGSHRHQGIDLLITTNPDLFITTNPVCCTIAQVLNFTKKQWTLRIEWKYGAMICTALYKGCRNKKPDSKNILNYNKKLLGPLFDSFYNVSFLL